MTIPKSTILYQFFNQFIPLPDGTVDGNLFLILVIRESYRNELNELIKSKLDKSGCKLLFHKVKYILQCSEQLCHKIWNQKRSTKNRRETDFFLVKIKLDASVSSIDFRNKAKSLIALEEVFSQLVGNATVEDISEAVDPEIIDQSFTKGG